MAQESYNPERKPDLSGWSRREISMAEGTVTPEGVASTTGSPTAVMDRSRDVPSPEARIGNWLRDQLGESGQEQPRPPTKRHGFTEEQVTANAALPEKERLEAAEKLLGPLMDEQKDAFSRMHAVGLGKPGKDQSRSASVYNYDQPQITKKARIGAEKTSTGKKVFTKEQRSILLESGLAGVVFAERFDNFNPMSYPPEFQPIATLVRDIGITDGADEVFLSGICDDIRAVMRLSPVNYATGMEFLKTVNSLRIEAATQRPDHRVLVEQLTRPPSFFENTIIQINTLEQQIPTLLPGSPARIQAEVDLHVLQNERDIILDEIRQLGWHESVKANLFRTFYESRVEVTFKEKTEKRLDGRPPVMDDLQNRQDIANTTSWEASVRFWRDLHRQAQLQALGGLDRVGGAIDYFERESLKLITEVVRNRKEYDTLAGQSYPNRGIIALWSGQFVLPSGERLNAIDFEDVRDKVEHERKIKPKIPNRGDYESWFALVADSLKEAQEMVPDIIEDVRGKLVGDPQTQNNTLQEERGKWMKAVNYLKTELRLGANDPEFIRLATMVRQGLNLLGVQVFANLVKETWEPFLNSATDIARGFKDTEFQDHTIDALLLDKDGMTMATLELLAKNHWEYYRFGPNNKDTGETMDYGDAKRWQQEKRVEIEEWLTTHELKPMSVLLNADVDKNGQLTINGNPTHPAFQRMKDELAVLDAADPLKNTPNFIPRWKEYVRKAIHWQRTGEPSDPKNKLQRVIFQHPLARAFRPKDFKDGQGNVSQVDEFWEMFRDINIPDPRQKGRVERKRTILAKTYFESAENIVKFSMADAMAGGPRHFFPVYDDNGIWSSPHGEIITNAQGQKLLKLPTGTEFVIELNSDGKPVVNGVEPHMKLVIDLMQKIIEQDGKKPTKRQLMKLHRIMKDKLGIDMPLPGFSDWYLGAHDSNRPHLLKLVREVDAWKQQLKERAQLREFDDAEGNDGYGWGADAKTALARDPEDGRRLRILGEMYIRKKLGKYYNYPGQDDPEGGIKEFKNILLQIYGISMGTVRSNALITSALSGEVDFLGAFGCETWAQFMGRMKGPNEIVYGLTRGFFVNPRDAENYVKRFAAQIEESGLWTKGGKDAEGGTLDTGIISAAFVTRAADVNPKSYVGASDPVIPAMADPVEFGYEKLDEEVYKQYVEISARVAGPMAKIMQARQKLENVYGIGPQSAMFLNTLLWYDVLRWMDEKPDEFRAKFGFAYDVNLPLARVFIHTFLYESGYIYNDTQWDRLMLGYTIPKDQWEAVQNWSGNPDTRPLLDSVVRKNTEINRVDKLIRYKANNGQTVGYLSKLDQKSGKWEWEYDPNANNVNDGEVVEGLLDALPKEIREEAFKKRWFPVGVQSYFPETLESLSKWLKVDKSDRNRAIYDTILKVIEEDETMMDPTLKKYKPGHKPRIVRKRQPILRT